MWLVTLINIRGVKEAGLFQSVTTYTKLVPFVAISLFGLFWVDWNTFAVINPSDEPFLGALAATAPLTMFAFLGIESATVPAGDVIDPAAHDSALDRDRDARRRADLHPRHDRRHGRDPARDS